ncbi:bifunctional RNase H/acid phosphatase [Georgenia wangjunii]|uniref:bifunctional RNase H/acid phosphatase n=1 Tax=Georgenia wangjunii TaxID=3117730 RepID=UPI002F26B60C
MSQPSLFADDNSEPTRNEPIRSTRTRRGGGSSGRVLVVEADGGSRGNPGHAGYGSLVREGGRVIAERGGYLGICSNNVAEYTGLVEGLRAAAEIDPGARVEVRMDSKLVVEQMSGRWKIKHEDMRRLAQEAREVFDPRRVTYTWIPRALNGDADKIANQVMDSRGEIRNDYPALGDADDDGTGEDASRDDEGAAVGGGQRRASGTANSGASEEPSPDDAGASGEAAPPPEVPARRTGGGVPIRRAEGDPVTVVLVRHGVTTLTERSLYSGGDTPGPELSDIGVQQVTDAAGVLARIGDTLWDDLPAPSVLVASPMLRTQHTARVIGERLGLGAATVVDAFAECRFGEWDGLSVAEMEEGWPGDLRRWASEDGFRPPGGESVADVGARVGAGLRALAAEHAGRTVVVAAHAVVIRAAVGVVAHMPVPAWSSVRVPPASVTILRLWPGDDGVGEITVIGCPNELGAAPAR